MCANIFDKKFYKYFIIHFILVKNIFNSHLLIVYTCNYLNCISHKKSSFHRSLSKFNLKMTCTGIRWFRLEGHFANGQFFLETYTLNLQFLSVQLFFLSGLLFLTCSSLLFSSTIFLLIRAQRLLISAILLLSK